MTTNGIARNGYIKNTFKRLESVHADRVLSRLIVKMNDQYIDDHLKLPHVLHHNVVCEDPVELLILENALSEHVRMILNGNDQQSAMEYLGCPVGSKENIISFVCKNLFVKIKNFEKKIEYLDNIESVDSESLDTVHTKRVKTQQKIIELQQKLQRIHDKIDTFAKDETPSQTCPVCLDDDQEMCMFTCCLNQFCTTCVDRLFTKQQHVICPLCRGKFQTMVLRKRSETPRAGTKYTETIRVIKERLACDDTSLLVFMWTDNTLRKLQRVLDDKGFVYRTLSGNGHTIQKTIRWFDEKRVRLLLINASLYGCGLDLSSATDVILFQRMHVDHENQLMGRAHRIGRTHELHVHRILHKNEL
jgi:SNF2 family DNA or RNA helicase